MKRGKLIVIDGTDGSGKATQAELLLKYLRKKGRKVKYVDFPRYHDSFHGKVVARYLAGEFGELNSVSPHLASLAYALDRLTAKPKLDRWLRDGKIVVSNRYVSSNMAFQAARLPKNKRREFLNWITEMEYKEHRLPKEDIVLFLHVPAQTGQRLVDRRSKKVRQRLGGMKRDIHEINLEYLRETERMYLKLCAEFKHWVKIECVDRKGSLKTREGIHKMIVKTLQGKRII